MRCEHLQMKDVFLLVFISMNLIGWCHDDKHNAVVSYSHIHLSQRRMNIASDYGLGEYC